MRSCPTNVRGAGTRDAPLRMSAGEAKFKEESSCFERCRHCDSSKHLNLSTIFVASHFLSVKVSSKLRLTLGFGT